MATGGRWEGDVRVDGHPQQKDTFARISGYAQQFDIHSPQVRNPVWKAWSTLASMIAQAHDEHSWQCEAMATLFIITL